MMGTSLSDQYLDRSFGAGGMTPLIFFDSLTCVPVDIGLTHDNKILVQADITPVIGEDPHHKAYGLCRLTENGVFDQTFGNGGSLTGHFFLNEDASAQGFDVSSDGRILNYGVSDSGSDVADQYKACLTRLLPDGQIDESFGNDGKAVIAVAPTDSREQLVSDSAEHSVEQGNSGRIRVLPDNRILVLLPPRFSHVGERLILRLMPSGEPDQSFNGGLGYLVIKDTPSQTPINVSGFAIDANNRILVYGTTRLTSGSSAPIVARYSENGPIDAPYGTEGFATYPGRTDQIDAVAVQPDGRVVTFGSYMTDNGTRCGALMRLSENGQPDGSFNAAESVLAPLTTDPYRWLGGGIKKNGDLMVAGTQNVPGNNQLMVANYLGAGLENRRFGAGSGFVLTSLPAHTFQFRRAALQRDTRFLCAVNAYTGWNDVKAYIVAYSI